MNNYYKLCLWQAHCWLTLKRPRPHQRVNPAAFKLLSVAQKNKLKKKTKHSGIICSVCVCFIELHNVGQDREHIFDVLCCYIGWVPRKNNPQ